MTENKKINVAIIIGLLAGAIILSMVAPRGPACMDTGHGYNCTATDHKKGTQ